MDFNLLPVLFGSGIGSSSFLNNSYIQFEDLANTNSQLVRLLYEAGLVGTFYFIKIFTTTFYQFTKLKSISGSISSVLFLSNI